MAAGIRPRAVILAAGNSSRMGFPKALLRIDGKTFLGRIMEIYRRLDVPVTVVLGEHRASIQESEDLSAVTVVVNLQPQRGQLFSLQKAIQAGPAASGVIVHPVDHPLVAADTVERLLEGVEQESDWIRIPQYRERRGHPVYFPACFSDEILEAPLEVGARWVVHHNEKRVLRIQVDDPGILWDIDTPGDLEAIRGRGFL